MEKSVERNTKLIECLSIWKSIKYYYFYKIIIIMSYGPSNIYIYIEKYVVKKSSRRGRGINGI